VSAAKKMRRCARWRKTEKQPAAQRCEQRGIDATVQRRARCALFFVCADEAFAR
jgi:hypothetical protein